MYDRLIYNIYFFKLLLILLYIKNFASDVILKSDPILRPVTDFRFLPQTPIMSKRKTLTREEMEIHQVLSPASGHQGGSVQSHRTPPTEKTKPQAQTLSLGDLSSLIKESVVSGVQQGLDLESLNKLCSQLEKANANKNLSGNPNNGDSSKRPRTSLDDNDLPRVGLDDVQEGTAPPLEVFGANVNNENVETDGESSESETEEPVPSPFLNFSNSRNPPHTPSKNTMKILETGIASSSAISDAPDADLPSVDPRPPAIWNPKAKIMKWVSDAVETEWSPEDRKKIVDKFHPEEKYDHLLNPVKMPKKLYKAIKAPSVKQKDYLFNRSNTEKDLFNASSDLCASLRPLIEAVSLLDDKAGCGNIKNLIGTSMMGIFSANKKISRGRRELGRKCVRLDCADALYGVPPSHFSLFGGASDVEAAKTAKETTKADDTLVYAPKTKKFRPSTTQGFQNTGKQNFQNPYFKNNYNNNNNNNNSNYKGKAWWYQNQPSRGRGRGKGWKNQKKHTKNTNPKD